MAVEKTSSVASYVVRIYRRTTRRNEHPESMAGLVENLHDKEPRAFHSMSELWNILRVSDARRPLLKRKGEKAPNRTPLHNDKDES